ncbi:MAG: FAD-dependent oxidoreductase [Acidobacteriota bacterium]|nr:FAD-dependent oxidoreductase [Acidobacteriota bacterium]
MSEHFDILVVGAGPAGIAAAVSAAAAGKRVGLADDNPAPGGQIWRSGTFQPAAARRWLARLNAAPLVRLQGWRIFDSPQRGTLRAERNSDCRDLCYEQLILATGARERFLPFPGWTLPNVMGAGGLDAMVRGGLPIAGKRVVVAGTGPLLLAVAAHLARRGAKVVAVCEQAPLRRIVPLTAALLGEPAKLLQGIAYGVAARGARFFTGCWPIAVNGREKLESVTLQRNRKHWDVGCDYLACGFHLVPNLELPALLGCRIENGFVVADDLQRTSVADVFCAGEPTGIGGVELALLEGQVAGLAAAGRTAEAEKLARRRKRQGFVHALRTASVLDPQLGKLASDTTIVCRCEDVPFAALREHANWRDAKLHTRCGMGPCQGRICGTAAEFLFGWSAASVQSSIRPPVFPALVSSLGASAKETCQSDGLPSAGASTGSQKEIL